MGDILSGIGAIFGGIEQGNAAQTAANASAQATAAQNKLNAQQEAIVQQMLQAYQQYQAPLQGGTSSQYSGLLGSDNAGGIESEYLNALLNPTATGVDTGTLANNAIGYLSNPTGTLSQQVGMPAIGSELSDASGGSVLGQVTPGILSGDQSAASFFANQMANGAISPDLIAQAMGQMSNQNQQGLNSLRNSLGGSANIGALLNQQGWQNAQGTASLLAQLTGQSQDMRNQAASGLTSANAATAGAASGLDAQQLQYLMQAMSTAGGLDSQTMSMLTQALGLGQGQQQQQLGNYGSAATSSQQLLQQIQNYINAGVSNVTGQQSVIQGLSNQAGQSAANAAGTAQTDFNNSVSNNPFSAAGSTLANYGLGNYNPFGGNAAAAASAAATNAAVNTGLSQAAGYGSYADGLAAG